MRASTKLISKSTYFNNPYKQKKSKKKNTPEDNKALYE